MPCLLEHIPERLHSNGRPAITTFSVGEILFRRSKKCDNPFYSISLVDISVNRQGVEPNILCEKEDVLFKFYALAEGESAKIEEEIYSLKIIDLTENNEYEKVFNDDNTPPNTARIHLVHKILDCNYSHAAFVVFYNDIEMTYDNYKAQLNKNSVLKTTCKNELAKMIIREEVSMKDN